MPQAPQLKESRCVSVQTPPQSWKPDMQLDPLPQTPPVHDCPDGHTRPQAPQ